MTIKTLLNKINPDKEVGSDILKSFFDIEMNNQSFYNIIDFIDWSKNFSSNSNTIKSSIIRIFSPYILDKFKVKIDDIYDNLDKTLSEYNKTKTLSDEDYSDLIYHIISKGEIMINRVLEYPQVSIKLIERNEVREAFDLCIPDKEDYQNISEFYYHEWAEGLLREIRVNEHSIAKQDLMKLRRVTRILNLISTDNKVELKVSLDVNFEEIDKFIIEVMESSIPLDYSFQNLIMDYYGFMIPFIEE